MKSVNSVVLLASILLLFTVSVANIYAQEYNDDDIKKEYYGYDNDDNKRYDEKSYYLKDDYYEPHKDGKKKDPTIKIKKELFVCEDIENVNPNDNTFNCNVFGDDGPDIADSPDSDRYVECNENRCPGIDESTFSGFVHKDVLMLQDLSSDGVTVDLDKFHYVVSEDELYERNGFGFLSGVFPFSECTAGFDEVINYAAILENNNGFQGFETENVLAIYDICILYDGDCQGTLHPGDEKICTIKNYIVSGGFSSDDNNDDSEPES